MNTKEFVKALRSVIREEVRSAVRQEIKEILIESVQQAANVPTKQVQPQVQRQQAYKKYTGNSVLDQVLNETRLTPDFRQSPAVDYEDTVSFTSEDIRPQQTSFMGLMNGDMDSDDLPVSSTSDLPFMKDYSQLLKKADKISSNRSL